MKQVTKEQAILINNKKLYEHWSDKKKVEFQLFQDKLSMPFNVFHAAIEKVLNRPVYTHEFATPKNLRKEFLGESSAPTLKEIIELIPKKKRLLISV